MPTFTIEPSDGSFMAGLTATSPAAVMHIIQRLECPQADVLSDGVYSFSVRLYGTGYWCVYRSDQDEPSDTIVAMG